MNRILLIIFLLATFSLSAQIRVKNPVQELGEVFEGNGIITSKFVLSNPYTNDTIRINHIETSCGCTAILSKDTMILPMSTIELDFSYDPAGRLGLFVKTIEIHTTTGRFERNKLYLKIAGNVVADKFEKKGDLGELLNYHVAPFSFYPITHFDTSYLSFNHLSGFVDDLSYEIDYHQFASVGFDVQIKSIHQIEELEKLLEFTKKKIVNEFKRRGYSALTVFFEEPHFMILENLPKWTAARVNVYSVNFNDNDIQESQIDVAGVNKEEIQKYILNYERFAMPTNKEIIDALNMDLIESKYFLNQKIELEGMILMPWKKSKTYRRKAAKSLTAEMAEAIKIATGGKKSNIKLSFDSLGIHDQDKYQFKLWDIADNGGFDSLIYEVKEDLIKAPKLPTYKQFLSDGFLLDTNNYKFQQFWSNLILNNKAGNEITILIESNLSTQQIAFDVSNNDFAKEWGRDVSKYLEQRFINETGVKLNVQFESQVRGPEFKLSKREKLDLDQLNYINLVPLVHNLKINDQQVSNPIIKPYQVNFDYFFKGIDTKAWGFKRFSKSLVDIVELNGYVKIAIESSVSQIKIDSKLSNDFVAYSRIVESELRIREAMAEMLIDPNRIIFVKEVVKEQGPKYDGTIPVLQYRKFHYIKLENIY